MSIPATPQHSALGRQVDHPRHYDPSCLFPIPRNAGRTDLGIDTGPLPFIGIDRWHAYELSWLQPRGLPAVATATLGVPADTPCLVESKSLKLYLNSFNATRFESADAVCACIARDLSSLLGGAVDVVLGLPAIATGEAAGSIDLDALDIDCDATRQPDPDLLTSSGPTVAETLHSALLKSNCPVTGQPDWATVRIAYRGPRIDHAGLLRYLVSFRDHAEFHEHCVERMFVDLQSRCRPSWLSVEARYTRRGGLDINPWRATPGTPPPEWQRDSRQ
ncbi:MAG TPA: NADPH-dependent 7-cyano-7-deazaguanine reductase QueF [Luteimonas sp.]|nr:NADPH-dependent 7-cyano-7-deazaguanine reductase QueF [Luteimonas sp.]